MIPIQKELTELQDFEDEPYVLSMLGIEFSRQVKKTESTALFLERGDIVSWEND